MAPSDPTYLLWQLSDEHDHWEDESLKVIKQKPIDHETLRRIDRKRMDTWSDLITRVLVMRQTHQTEVDDFMKLRHCMIWGTDEYEYE